MYPGCKTIERLFAVSVICSMIQLKVSNFQKHLWVHQKINRQNNLTKYPWRKNTLECRKEFSLQFVCLFVFFGRSKGVILNISSASGMYPVPLLTVYSATKVKLFMTLVNQTVHVCVFNLKVSTGLCRFLLSRSSGGVQTSGHHHSGELQVNPRPQFCFWPVLAPFITFAVISSHSN